MPVDSIDINGDLGEQVVKANLNPLRGKALPGQGSNEVIFFANTERTVKAANFVKMGGV